MYFQVVGIMTRREKNWENLLESLGDEFNGWLQSDEPTFQIRSEDFKRIGVRPVRLIPTYSAMEVPIALRKRGLEHFRNLSGGCILIQTNKLGIPTLFPTLPARLEQMYETIEFPKDLDLLKNLDLHNEETGIVLLREFGLINKFLETNEEFKLGGRLKTKVSGEAIVSGKIVQIVDTQLEVDNFLESTNRIIVIEAKLMKENPRESFSLHQFALPTLLLSHKTNKPITSLLLEYRPEGKQLRFRLFHYNIRYEKGRIHLASYELLRSLEIVIRVNDFQKK